MYNSLPVPFTGATVNVNNPGLTVGTSNAAPSQVQIRNASGWVITVATINGQQMIDPYTAATVPIDVGQQSIQIIGALNAYTSLSTGYLSLQWLLPNESPTEPDGPLTSAATIATISGTITNTPQQKSVIPWTSLVFSGTGTQFHTFTINTNPTDRSVVFFMNTTASSGTVESIRTTITGNSTFNQYGQGELFQNFVSGLTLQDYIFALPVYGTIETSFTVTIAVNFGGSPGSLNMSLAAFSVPDENLITQAQILDALGNLTGINSNPFYVTSNRVETFISSGDVPVTTTAVNLITPSIGLVTVVDSITLESSAGGNGIVVFTWNGQQIGALAFASPITTPTMFNPNWHLIQPGSISVQAFTTINSIHVKMTGHMEDSL